MKFHYYLFALMLLASLILINGGITGKVASSPSGTNAQPLLQNALGPSIFVSLLGFLILIGAIFMLYSRHKLKHRYG